MPKALAQFRPGMQVQLECYQEDCQQVRIPGTLTKTEAKVHSAFRALSGVGWIRWRPGSAMRDIRLLRDVQCPNCKRFYQWVIIVSNGSGKKSTIFAYESEPA